MSSPQVKRNYIISTRKGMLRVTSRVAEQLKIPFFSAGGAKVPTQEKKKKKTEELRKLGNFKDIPEILEFDSEYPSTQKPNVDACR